MIRRLFAPTGLLGAALAVACAIRPLPAASQPVMTDARLQVRTVVAGLNLPTAMAVLGPGEFFVIEKNSGRVMHVKDSVIEGEVLDLAVNNSQERGLLGIALHPNFPADPGVYLYWTCATAGPPADPFVPDVHECPDPPALGGDSEDILAVPLLANRIDRFRWTGSSLVYEKNLIKIRQFQNDAAPTPPNQGDETQPPRGNHDAGVLAFGPDGKLYAIVGDAGRRGQLQNLPSGPTLTGTGPVVADDQFGGPQPDDAHFTGVILRLNDDGTTPADNPFFALGAQVGGEVGENLQKIWVYGIRNSFGMAFDPVNGDLWWQENGEDAFDEINRGVKGMNSGWIQVTGPLARIAEYKQIETTSLHGGEPSPNLQQLRWGPERIADSPDSARARMFDLPGSTYRDPEFAWKYVVAPAGIGFLSSAELGAQFKGDLFLGLAVPMPLGGPLLRFHFAGPNKRFQFDEKGLDDGVADNADFNQLGESESLVIGQGFGVVTDIKTSGDGLLDVVSLSNGAVYEISAAPKGKRGGTAAAAGLAFRTRPNPARGGTTIALSVARPQRVQAAIYDVRGKLVRRLETQAAGQGLVTLSWDGRSDAGTSAAAGVYTIRVRSEDGAGSERFVLLR